jgi:hypothetical protein
VDEPSLASFGVNAERHVPHAQARVTARIGVLGGTTPVLLEKKLQPDAGWFEVLFGVHGAEHRIVGNTLVERVSELDEGGVPTNLVKERRLTHSARE